jgi:hypothetical protein
MAVFELGGALSPAIPDLTVGPWRAPPGLAAFDAPAGPPESLWRVSLARAAATAQAELAEGERDVARTHAALDDGPRRLESAFVDIAVHRPAPLLSWDTEAAETMEQEPDVPGRIERALAQIGDLARGRARIETRIGGAVVAHSLMTLSGDTELWAMPGLSASGAKLHARSVAIAIRTRHAWARILVLVVRGYGRILTLGLPSGGVAALPLLWRFIRDLLRELRDARAVPRTA